MLLGTLLGMIGVILPVVGVVGIPAAIGGMLEALIWMVL